MAAADTHTLPPIPFFKILVSDEASGERCLEANEIGLASAAGGATVMDDCRGVSGQAWLAVPIAQGFRLQSWLHGTERCLAVNAGEVAHLQEGTAYMARCDLAVTLVARALEGEPSGKFVLAIAGEADAGDEALDCLGPLDDAWADRYVAVGAQSCEAAMLQPWTIAGSFLDARSLTGPLKPAPTPGVSDAETLSECSWNDGTSDRADAYPCKVLHSEDGDRIDVEGPGHTYSLILEPGRWNIARGVLRIGETAVDTGVFRRLVEDVSCWSNGRTGERLCIR